MRAPVAVALAAVLVVAGCAPEPEPPSPDHPWHTGIVATTFWVGEVFDAGASDGSQVLSTYDARWQENYGGCDGIRSGERCETEPRTAANDFFPTAMTPKQNPFYLDLPFDDLNDPGAFARRAEVVPWADRPGFRGRAADEGFSYLKNRWVQLRKDGRTCYGQVQDAGPAQYDDAEYVFGGDDRRPVSQEFNGAGLDVSPALNGCLGFAALDGESDVLDWRFAEDEDVPGGPWKRIVTTQGVVR